MYADTVTGSMQRAIDETNRRRTIQAAYNQEHGITPQTIQKAILALSIGPRSKPELLVGINPRDIPPDERERAIKELSAKMDLAAKNLEFERAAELRDMIKTLRDRHEVDPS
jgi:excinuclease ABC subunit B